MSYVKYGTIGFAPCRQQTSDVPFRLRIVTLPPRLDCHRQRGCVDEIKVRRDTRPVLHDREIRRAGGRASGIVGRAQNTVTDARIGHVRAQRIDKTRNL